MNWNKWKKKWFQIQQQIDNNGKRMRTHFAENPVIIIIIINNNRWDCGAYYKANLIFKAHVPTYQLLFFFFASVMHFSVFLIDSFLTLCTNWIFIYFFFISGSIYMILTNKKEITKLTTINKIIALLHRFTLR